VVLGPDDVDGRGGVLEALGLPGHAGHLDLEELVQAQVRKVLLARVGGGGDPARELLNDPHLLGVFGIWLLMVIWLLAG